MARLLTRFDMPFPVKGLVESTGYEAQPKGTTVDCQNVRAYDPGTGRSRGGQRAGLTKYVNARTADGKVKDIGQVVSRDVPSSQAEVGARTVYTYAVTNGTIAKVTTSGFTTASSGSSALSSSVPVVFGAELFGVVYFADGTNAKKWTASTNAVSNWTASSGSLPADSSNKPRLIETWRGRIVTSGISSDPHNWFMSAVGDARNWNYSPSTPSATQAVAGNNAEAGKSQDIINAMCPYSDDILLIFGDHSIWQMTGDPAEGGRLDLISDSIGSPFGRPYCKSPEGIVYFFGSTGGVYQMQPGSPPQNITENAIQERMNTFNSNTTLVRMVWSDRERGFYVFLTPLGGGTTVNYYYDVRNQSWWPDKFGNNSHNPVSVHTFDGDAASDRTVLLGGQDGYLRRFDYDTPSKTDDSTAIDSYVYLGPVSLKNRPKLMLTEMKAALGTGSNDVAFNIYTGETAQAAHASSTSQLAGTFSAGRNKSERRRATGHDIFIKLQNNTDNQSWSYEFLGLEFNSFDGPIARQW